MEIRNVARGIVLLALLPTSSSIKPDSKAPICSVDMFNDTNALLACRTVDALQNNWFPSPIAGLYSYLDWNGYDGFWQNGVVLETLANFMHYTNSSRYESVLRSSWRPLDDLVHAYFPLPSCDDEMWFGLAFARIYEILGDKRFLNTSIDVFNWTMNMCYDYTDTCNGGVFFGGGRGAKITITNGQTMVLGAKLYRLTGNDDFLDKALRVATYLNTNQVVHPESFLVSDSINVTSCEANNKTNYTYNSGMIIGGLVQLYLATNKSSFLEIAHTIAKANIKHLSHDGVLTEYCDFIDNCDNDLDAHMFKGIFVRNIRYLMDVSNAPHETFYRNWIQSNIDNILANASCGMQSCVTSDKCNMSFIDGPPVNNITGPAFTTNWHGPYEFSAPAQQTQALDLLISGIAKDTTCKGHNCNYNPRVNITKIVSCDDEPCPANQACCSWQGSSGTFITCCAPYQYCYSGGCY